MPQENPERLIVNVDPHANDQAEPTNAHSEPDNNSDHKPPTNVVDAVRNWVHKTFPRRENAFWGGVFGLIVALLVMWIGIFRSIFLLVFIVIGVMIGQAIDGDAKLINLLRRFFSSGSH